MTRPSLKIVVLFVACVLWAAAQEKPTPAGKPQQDPRALGVTAPDTMFKSPVRDSAAKATQGLPKFDLPEYVITGAVSIDLPDVEKQDPVEPLLTLDLVNPLDAARDRVTVDCATEKEAWAPASRTSQNGRILAGSGTYFTSNVGVWVSTVKPGYSLFGDAGYGVSGAYVPFANRSGGHVDIFGGMTLRGPSDFPGGARLIGDLGYANDVYRFYGSPSPGVTRSVARFRLNAGLESPRDFLYNYGAQAGLLVVNVADSSGSNTETQFNLGFESNVLVGSFPLDGKIDLSLASIAGSGSGALPYLHVSLLTPKHWFGDIFVQGSVHLYVTQGMLGQKLARVYPNVEVGYRIVEGSVLSAAYRGKVQFNTLANLIETNPYLSASSIIRQSDIPLNLSFALETDWNEVWRTKFSARFQSIREYPLFTEGGLGPVIPLWGAPGHRGIWVTDYIGTTAITSYQAEVFAKFDANSYFTLSLELNTSKNSKTQWEVPYLPEVRLGGGFLMEVLRGLTIHPTVAYVGLRVPDLYEPSKLKEHVVLGVRGEYSALRFLNIFLDIQNLTDSKYDEWNGYRAAPFVMTAGIGLRW
ncbi:MAG: hypothetical protein NTU47_08250 [Ignavibacteriales bacterium]|nr:hypothetical protein [Ignavibacteriales bacterium]